MTDLIPSTPSTTVLFDGISKIASPRPTERSGPRESERGDSEGGSFEATLERAEQPEAPATRSAEPRAPRGPADETGDGEADAQGDADVAPASDGAATTTRVVASSLDVAFQILRTEVGLAAPRAAARTAPDAATPGDASGALTSPVLGRPRGEARATVAVDPGADLRLEVESARRAPAAPAEAPERPVEASPAAERNLRPERNREGRPALRAELAANVAEARESRPASEPTALAAETARLAAATVRPASERAIDPTLVRRPEDGSPTERRDSKSASRDGKSETDGVQRDDRAGEARTARRDQSTSERDASREPKPSVAAKPIAPHVAAQKDGAGGPRGPVEGGEPIVILSDARPAATTAAPAATAPGSSPVPVETILSQVRVQVRAGVKDLQIRLDPPELGRLHLRFQVEGGAVRVSVIATRPDVAAALKADLSAFVGTLREAGIDVASLDVDVESRDSGESFAEQFQDAHERGERARRAAARIHPIHPTPTERAAATELDVVA